MFDLNKTYKKLGFEYLIINDFIILFQNYRINIKQIEILVQKTLFKLELPINFK